MATRSMLVIRDASGEIVGAQVEASADEEVVSYITPADPEHTLHRISDVPSEICDLADPAAFHRALTDHVKSEHAKVSRIHAQDLEAAASRRLADRGGESRGN
jgi:hypothetical protein